MKVEIAVGKKNSVPQCQKPTGWLGRLVLWNMNSRHSKVTDWGLAHVAIDKGYTILDVGCGGGKTLTKLAGAATEGKIYGIDHSEASVAATKRTNARWIESGRVDVRHGSVSHLPFPDSVFDLVTAVETHFWWPDLPGDMREVFRVLKHGAKLVVIAEVYKGANTAVARLSEKYAPKTGIKMLSIDEHRELFANTGYSEIQIDADPHKGWICAAGRKP